MNIAKQEARKLISKHTDKEPTEKEINELYTMALELCPSLDSHPYRLAAIMSLLDGIGERKLIASRIPRFIRAGEISTAAHAFLEWCFIKGQHVPEIERRRRAEMAIFIKEGL